MASGQGPQREEGVGVAGVGHLTGPGIGQCSNEFGVRQVAVVVTQAGRGVDQQGTNLTPRRLLGLDG